MTTIDTAPETAARLGTPGSGSFLAGLASWAVTSDHKRVGRLFVGSGLLALLATAVVGVLLGIERVDGEGLVFRADVVGPLFQAELVGLVFATALPLGVGLAVAVVPLQLGARALAFPRLALGAYYTWLAGLVLVVVSLSADGGIGGTDPDMVQLFLLGHVLMALGLAAAAGTVATSVLTTRAPGMTMRRVPLFAWSALVTSIGLLLVLPVLVGVLVYLVVDLRAGGVAFGGADGMGAWIGWVFSQPATSLFALPAVGVAAELAPVTFRTRQVARGVVFTGIGLVAVSALAATTQQARFGVPWVGDPADDVRDLVPYAVFHLLPILGVVIVMGMGLLTALRGTLRLTAPFLFAFFGLGMVLVGMVGGALSPLDDLELQGTVFDEGVLVYVAYGTALGVLGGLLHWAPKLWGRRVPELPAMALALLGVTATVLAALPYYVAGFADQPAASSIFSYSGPSTLWNVLVLVGHAAMGLTVLGAVALLLTATTGRGEPAPDDPWGGHTVEWAAPSPAPGNNFAEVPVVTSAEPLLDRPSDADAAPTADGSST